MNELLKDNSLEEEHTYSYGDKLSKRETVIFSFLEWKEIIGNCTNKKSKRKSLNENFHRELTKKLKFIGLNCYLKCKFNWFSNSKNIHKRKAFWKGIYTCLGKCDLLLCAIIKNEIIENNDIIISIFYEKSKEHENINKAARCIGISRKKMGYKIMENGVSNTLANNIISNGFLNNLSLFILLDSY